MDVSVNQSGEDDNDIIIGIDLGTTYSCVAIYRYGRVEIITNDQGNRITPSYVAFTSDGTRLIGDPAKHQISRNPENTVCNVKRLIGRKWSDPSLKQDIKCCPFKVCDKNNSPHIEMNTADGIKIFTPEEISAMVLRNIRTVAENYLGKEVKKAVVTVPAYFNRQQRQATIDAASISGLAVDIINEPTAAALAYGLDKREGQFNILVFDLGGGTFDVSLVSIDNGYFTVRATNGDTHLGGEDFDRRVVDFFISRFSQKKRKDIRNNQRAIQRLRGEVEKGKRVLSSAPQFRLEIDSFVDGEDFSELLTRAKFEELNMDLFNKTLQPLKQVLKDAKLLVKDIKEVLLVGGSTRIPKIRQLVTQFFNGKEPSLDINPDEAVACGAAIKAAMLSGKIKKHDLVLHDVTPLTLSTNVVGGIAHKMIPRNTPIPKRVSSTFDTTFDGQTEVKVKICEGERQMFKDNHFLGSFMLTGIPPAPRGISKIETIFEVDANGILKVMSVNKRNGNIQGMAINILGNSLSANDIKRMIRDAEKYAEKDKKMLATAQARNRLESCLSSTRNMIKDDSTSLSQYKKKKVSAAVNRVISWVTAYSGADADDYNKKIEEIQALLHDKRRKQRRPRDELGECSTSSKRGRF